MSDRRMYPEALAIRCIGKKHYRPSNGTEGDMFSARWCQDCSKDDYDAGMFCPIISAAMCFDVGTDGFPDEWTHDANGQPCCTAFESYEDVLSNA